MAVFQRLASLGRALKREIVFYRMVAKHERTPTLARVAIGAALAYAASPIDLIPDWIPVIGHLDDLVIVPALIYAGIKLVPDEVIRECRDRVEELGGGVREPGAGSLDRGEGRE